MKINIEEFKLMTTESQGEFLSRLLTLTEKEIREAVIKRHDKKKLESTYVMDAVNGELVKILNK